MSMNNKEVFLVEDEAGKICRRYLYGKSSVVISEEAQLEGRDLSTIILQTLSNIFMPAGYPKSVTSDYFTYQFYDSLQAFTSSIAGLLASRAVLEGVGVGDANASATQALLLTITQDAVSRLATILFAWRIGTALEPETKRYRLLADIFNDGAMIMDCLSPALPKHTRLFSLCVSGSLRALCGVAAGGAKAALSVHFARANNVGDLNAKDSSQETVIGLLGMLAGSFVVSRVTSQPATWTLLLLLLAIHLSTNYLAVRAVAMNSLNRQRAGIAYAQFRATRTVPSPAQAARLEYIFAAGGRLYVDGRNSSSWCEIGVGLDGFFRLSRETPTGSSPWTQRVLQILGGEKYILWLSPPAWYSSSRQNYSICLMKGSDTSDHLKSWVHAMELAHMSHNTDAFDAYSTRSLELLADSLQVVNDIFPTFLRELAAAGWDVGNPALMTLPSFRVSRARAEEIEEKKSK